MKTTFDRKIAYLIIFTLAWLAIGAAILLTGWTTTWTALHIPVLSPSLPFEDIRTVQGSLYSVELGFNPQVQNPGDPWNRAMNYPIIWYWIAKLFQFDHEINLILFVCTYILAYIAAGFLLLRNSPSVYFLLAVFSWPSLLAVERGNNDLLAFALLFAGITLSQRYWRAFFILLTSVLKIYPALLVVTLAKKPKILIALILIIAGFFIFNFGELKNIQAGNTALSDPLSLFASYGLDTTIRNIQNVIPGQPPATYEFLKVALIFISLPLIIILSWSKYLKLTKISPYKTDLFISGGIVFSGTFLITSNWDYRLIFLLFCVPYILSIQNRLVKHSMLIGIILSSNSGFLFWGNLPQSVSMLFTMIKYFVFLMVSACLVKEIANNVPVFSLKRVQQIYATVLDRMHGENKPWYLQPSRWLLIVVLLTVTISFTDFAYKFYARRFTSHYGTLNLHITGLRPPGNMIIHLQSVGNTNFSRNMYRSFDTAEMTYAVDGLYFGDYVIQVVHDENNNQAVDVDSQTGLINEGFGMANLDKLNLQNAAAMKEGGTSGDLKYTYDENGNTAEIKMYYPPFPWQTR
jgi:hypothetical protein